MRAELRKNQILECAKGLFSKKGYYKTHVEDVLREAGIGKGTFYQYFRNKEDLFISLLVKFLDEWEEAVLTTTTELADDDLQNFYRALIKRSLQFFAQNEDLCNIYLRIGPGIDEIFEPYIEQFEEKMIQYVVDELERGTNAGILRQGLDIELTANILVGAFLRLDYYYFVFKKQRGSSMDIDKITDQFFSFIMDGILLKS
jgi:AcrR family transcriptional regulator